MGRHSRRLNLSTQAFLTFVLIASLSGCTRQADHSQTHSATAAATPTTFDSQDSQRDQQVLLAVLHDLLSPAVKRSPFKGSHGPPASIDFLLQPDSTKHTLEDAGSGFEKENWSTLTPQQQQAYRVASNHLHARKTETGLFHDLSQLDKRVQTTQDDSWNNRLKLMRAHRPGYSPDRRYAVVEFSTDWAPWHPCRGVYLLHFTNGAWRVDSRHFVYYA